jgi:hypothetical protein
VTKHNFDQTPKLLETFDQVIRSSEIRSSDPLSRLGLIRISYPSRISLGFGFFSPIDVF